MKPGKLKPFINIEVKSYEENTNVQITLAAMRLAHKAIALKKPIFIPSVTARERFKAYSVAVENSLYGFPGKQVALDLNKTNQVYEALRDARANASAQVDSDKWDSLHRKINGYGTDPTIQTCDKGACKPSDCKTCKPTEYKGQAIDRNKWPHTCSCGAPAYLAGPGYSECSNPDCEELK